MSGLRGAPRRTRGHAPGPRDRRVNAGADFTPLAIAVGHASDVPGGTGLTVIRGVEAPLRCGATVVGRATGTREIDATSPLHLVDRIDAVVLTGGSAYGLDAAGGVMRWMEERGRGFPVGGGVVPIVPAAVIFDLAPCGRFDARPTADMGYAAADRATTVGIAQGSVGAGTGATVGKAAGRDYAMKGGIGCATITAGSLTVGAVAVVNAIGDVRDGAGSILAGARDAAGGFLDARVALANAAPAERFGSTGLRNTTLALVAVNALMTRIELRQLSTAASAALYRRITPTGTTVDGDIVFAVGPTSGVPAAALQIEILAVAALEQAIENAVRFAEGRDGIPGLADVAAGP